MNYDSKRRIKVAISEEQMYEKLEQFKIEGFSESDIHVVSKEHSHMRTLNRHSDATTHEAGNIMDKFKSWFTGKDAIKEGLRNLNLSDSETERYSNELEKGGIILYTEGEADLNERDVATPPKETFNEGLKPNQYEEPLDPEKERIKVLQNHNI